MKARLAGAGKPACESCGQAQGKRWVWFVLVLLLAMPILEAQRPGERGRVIPGVTQIDQEEGERVIEAFRHQRLRGDYVFHFDLEYLPRRGEKSVYEGLLWGTWTDQGPLSRLILWHPERPREPLVQVLAQSGADAKAWVWYPDQAVREVEPTTWFEPILEGNPYTFFDLLMPFVFWDDHVYEGTQRVRGRPAHQFIFWPPDAVRQARPDLGAVFVSLDASYNALLKADLLDQEGELLQGIEIGSFRRVGEQWIVRSIDLSDAVTRDKSRFLVRGAAVGKRLDPAIFDPDQLAKMPSLQGVELISL